MDELIPKLKEEEILEEINETNSDNNNKENQLFSSLFVKVENNQNGQKMNNVPNLKAALEQLLRNAQGRKLRQKTRRMLRQSNPNIILPNLNDKEIIDLANINDKTSTKREGKVGIFSTNPFIRNQHPSIKPWMRGFWGKRKKDLNNFLKMELTINIFLWSRQNFINIYVWLNWGKFL